jgi:hypothetical protein
MVVTVGSAIAPLLINEATKKVAVPSLVLNGSTTAPVPELNDKQMVIVT